MAERAQRRLERHRLWSGLPQDKRLENFHFAPLPMLSKAHVQALAQVDQAIVEGKEAIYCRHHRRGRLELVRLKARREEVPKPDARTSAGAGQTRESAAR